MMNLSPSFLKRNCGHVSLVEIAHNWEGYTSRIVWPRTRALPMPMGFWVGMGSILLCIPASNSRSESNFSVARNTLTKKHSGLKASAVALHLHLHPSCFIRDADVDGGWKPNGPWKLDFGMKSLARTIADPA